MLHTSSPSPLTVVPVSSLQALGTHWVSRSRRCGDAFFPPRLWRTRHFSPRLRRGAHFGRSLRSADVAVDVHSKYPDSPLSVFCVLFSVFFSPTPEGILRFRALPCASLRMTRCPDPSYHLPLTSYLFPLNVYLFSPNILCCGGSDNYIGAPDENRLFHRRHCRRELRALP